MNLASLPRRQPPGWRRAALLPALLLFWGCGREEIRVYTAPKDPPAPSTAINVRPRPMARPQVEWTLPATWSEQEPGQMNFASFAVAGNTGQEAHVAITLLPLMAGRESMVLNLVRQQAGHEPLSEEEAQQQLQSVEIGGEQGRRFEFNGPDQSRPERTVLAMAHLSDASWFFKLSGDAALVEAQKPVFLEFLKSIRIKASPASESIQASQRQSTKFNWQVPARWKALPAGDMQVARFAVPERGRAKAEVFVSVFDGDTGGTLANVNRWRRDLGMREVDDAGLPQVVSPLDPADPRTKLIDFTNNNRRLIAAIVPRDGRYWFYKLHGDLDAVSPERDAFVAFVKSTP
ncbi:MAG TPA: hypothetical protein VFT34_04180 [Verrucomicrobiae bacterium]|nr:hypothetical protein [Verrucomicrobiae bacterium]